MSNMVQVTASLHGDPTILVTLIMLFPPWECLSLLETR